jgi:hypothetical protein
MDAGENGNLRRLAILSRLGFYTTFAAVVGLVAVCTILGIAAQTENHFFAVGGFTFSLLTRGVAGGMFAGFALSLSAVRVGEPYADGSRTAWRFYIIAKLSAVVSGLLLLPAFKLLP